MTILVTGATGFVGSTLVARLVRSGATVRILRRDHSRLDLLRPVDQLIEHAIGDITSRESLDRAFEGVDAVYHVAATVSDDPRTGKALLRRANVHGTANVVDAAIHAGVTRMVHTSSMAAFGRGFEDTRRINEDADWEASSDNSDYAESKHFAELEVHRGIAEGLDAVIVNPSLVFGVGRKDENTRKIIESVRRGSVPAIPEGGTNVVDVEDVVEGHVLAMK
ncbi:MAG: NAD-dependent epimerase/dehydratase family protein, partial [Rhodothermales bacterium]|nr:NAD-dependent epimerase/dehydratase family protein [Rhodothermales bacterium]